jgi:hypothetical protein
VGQGWKSCPNVKIPPGHPLLIQNSHLTQLSHCPVPWGRDSGTPSRYVGQRLGQLWDRRVFALDAATLLRVSHGITTASRSTFIKEPANDCGLMRSATSRRRTYCSGGNGHTTATFRAVSRHAYYDSRPRKMVACRWQSC